MNLPAGNPTCPRGQERLICLGDGACYESSVGAAGDCAGLERKSLADRPVRVLAKRESYCGVFRWTADPENRVLIDDSVLRYYLHPTLRQERMTDPFYFVIEMRRERQRIQLRWAMGTSITLPSMEEWAMKLVGCAQRFCQT